MRFSCWRKVSLLLFECLNWTSMHIEEVVCIALKSPQIFHVRNVKITFTHAKPLQNRLLVEVVHFRALYQSVGKSDHICLMPQLCQEDFGCKNANASSKNNFHCAVFWVSSIGRQKRASAGRGAREETRHQSSFHGQRKHTSTLDTTQNNQTQKETRHRKRTKDDIFLPNIRNALPVDVNS